VESLNNYLDLVIEAWKAEHDVTPLGTQVISYEEI